MEQLEAQVEVDESMQWMEQLEEQVEVDESTQLGRTTRKLATLPCSLRIVVGGVGIQKDRVQDMRE